MNWIEFNSFELAQLSEFGPYSTSLQRDTLWKKVYSLSQWYSFPFLVSVIFSFNVVMLASTVETETFQPSP